MNVTVASHAVIYREGNVLIVRRSETDDKRPLQWDLPGGIGDDDEEFNLACSREIKEETGIEIGPDQLRLAYAQTEYFPQNDNNVTWLIFVAESKETDVKLSYEHDMFEWVSLDEAISRIDYARYKGALKHLKATGNLVQTSKK